MITAATVAAGIGLLTAAIGGAWTWWNSRSTANNTPAMQQAQENAKQLAAADQLKADVASGDEEKIREDLR